ncbi:hypothetical protein [Alistipes dispar]|uniref:hypothetical protein n=1 Tax=Alistipes dispar TaxID=2585119 RepID=UPI003A87D302
MEKKKKILSLTEKIRPLEKDATGHLRGGFQDIGIDPEIANKIKNKGGNCKNENCSEMKNKASSGCTNVNCTCSCQQDDTSEVIMINPGDYMKEH